MIEIQDNLEPEYVRQAIEKYFGFTPLAEIKEYAVSSEVAEKYNIPDRDIIKRLNEYADEKDLNREDTYRTFLLSFIYMPGHWTHKSKEGLAENVLDNMGSSVEERKLFWLLYAESILQDDPLTARHQELSITNQTSFEKYLEEGEIEKLKEARESYTKAEEKDKLYWINKKIFKNLLEKEGMLFKENIKILEEIIQEAREERK